MYPKHMQKTLLIFSLLFSLSSIAETDFEGMLKAAKDGDSMARVVIANTYYFGEYRDGTVVEKDLNKAYAWASLANYQGEGEAKKLVYGIIPKLEDKDFADNLTGEYFRLYGAERGSANK